MQSHTLNRARPARALSPLLAAALVAGCSFIPTYERPAAPVPQAYPLAGAESTTSARAAADIDWKEYFTDPCLQRLIGMALGNNRDLRVAMLNVEQARAQFQIQRANQFPTVNAIASGTRQPSATTGSYANQFQVGLGISAWEIDFFGRVAALKEQALAQYLATDEARKSAQISLVAAVASGWLTLMADEELLDISRRTLETRDESVKLTRLRLENGVSSELDNRQAESLAQAARATYAQQQRQRMLDENALVLLLGQPLPDDIRASLPSSRLADATPMQVLPAGLPSDLLVRRPDVRMAEQQLIGANANIGAARAAFFPRISLTAQFGTVSDELSGLFKSGSWAFSLAPQLALPIFDAGRNQAGLESARAGREIAVAQYEKSIQTAFREVSDALAGQATLQEQVDAQRAQAQADAKRFELSDLRYRNGVASYLDLLDAQRSLFATEQSLVVTRLQQLQNQVTLYKVLGGGWTAPAEETPRS
ncbi:efflux transporter outer membrane subunit [Diaphorobacter sp.]|uniref:efflux transporter outer membrane subunit n=1 Tax=Diaphorobacter sp. TaxID=1934310 RepID=UPI00289DC5BA|nr:efflux transporter outer membrane subunit [Diaphorobacter sp.]